jgi:hypothetical protein
VSPLTYSICSVFISNPSAYKDLYLPSVPEELRPLASALFDGDLEAFSKVQIEMMDKFKSSPQFAELIKQFSTMRKEGVAKGPLGDEDAFNDLAKILQGDDTNDVFSELKK